MIKKVAKIEEKFTPSKFKSCWSNSKNNRLCFSLSIKKVNSRG